MIAVIAGTGNLPQQACKNLLKNNKPFFVISLFSENNGALLQITCKNKAPVFAEKFYKAGKIIALLKKQKTKQVLFIGKVDKRNLFKKIKLDWLGIKILASMATKSDNVIMEKLLQILETENIEIIKQTEILESLIVKPGILTGTVTNIIQENITFGMNIADHISNCDIGQTVVVKDKMIIAVEAIEGTNECIKRAINLGKKDLVVCKTAHKTKNTKYDLPTLGPNSLDGIERGQIAAIAWKSTHTFIANQQKFITKATELGITLVST